MQIVRRSQRMKVEQYAIEFDWKDEPGGYSFPCTKTGEILYKELQPACLDNLEKCLNGTYAVTLQGVKDYSYTVAMPAQGRCDCRLLVELEGFTNTCACGREYNSSGQLLAPRSQWEEAWDDDGLLAWGDGLSEAGI